MNRQSKIIFLFLSMFFNVCWGQNNFAGINDDVRNYIEHYKSKNKIPGISLSVSYSDTLIFSEGFGYADVENKLEVIPSVTKFRIASITKTLTAGTVAKMSELGLIDINKSPYYYLDSLPKKQYSFTIKEIGGHLAGLQRIAGEEKYTCDNTYNRRDFYRVFDKDPLLFQPSVKMEYSNYGYKLLGVIIEEITGKDVTGNHNKYILEPLGLKNTFPETAAADFQTKFYIKHKGELMLAPCLECTFKYAQGCYLSTSEDLVKLGNGFLYVNRILDKESLITLATSQSLSNGKKTHYGFGFITAKDFYGNFFYGHNGGYVGSKSILRIYPKSKVVIAILMNTSIEDIDNLATEISQFYISKL